MTWRRLLGVLVLSVSLVSTTLACSSSTDPAKPASCPPDDPATKVNESECKEIATASAGGQAVQKRQCVSCHGNNMAGRTTSLPAADTPLGEKVELYPPNLTPDPVLGVGKWTDDALALAIRSGVDDESEQLCPQMNHFADMSDFEVYSIVKYLRSIPPVSQKVLRSVCPPLKTKEQQALAP